MKYISTFVFIFTLNNFAQFSDPSEPEDGIIEITDPHAEYVLSFHKKLKKNCHLTLFMNKAKKKIWTHVFKNQRSLNKFVDEVEKQESRMRQNGKFKNINLNLEDQEPIFIFSNNEFFLKKVKKKKEVLKRINLKAKCS